MDGNRANRSGQRLGSDRRRAGLAVLAAVLLVIVLLACGYLLLSPARDGGATLGTYEGMSREEIQAELDRQVEESMMTISLDVSPTLSEDGRKLAVKVQNVEDNKFDQKIVIEQGDREIGSYTGLKPGEKLDEIEVDGAEPGEATVTVWALERDSSDAHGSPSSFEVEIVRAE